MIKIAKFKITGVAPLIMHNSRGANVMDPLARMLKKYSSQRTKTDETYDAMARIEWFMGMYSKPWISVRDEEIEVDPEARAIIPANTINGVLVSGAKKRKLGKVAQASVLCTDNSIVKYTGPNNLVELFECGRFTSQEVVSVQRNKIVRTRPIFDDWWAEITIQYDTDAVELSDVEEMLVTGGRVAGIGDWRPRHGRFTVERIDA